MRAFFERIADKKIEEALEMMDADNNTKQMWGVNFKSLESLKVTSMEPAFQEEWTAHRVIYKVQVEARAKTDQYGWMNDPNTRWVTVEYGRIHELANNP